MLIVAWIYELNFYLRDITLGFVAGPTVLDAVNQPHEELAHRLKETRRTLAQCIPEAKQSVADSAKAGEGTFALRLGLAILFVLISKLRVDLVHNLFARGHTLIDNLARGRQHLKALEQARTPANSSQLLKLILVLERWRIAVLVLTVVLIVCGIGFVCRLIYIVVFGLVDIAIGRILRGVVRLVLVDRRRHMRLLDRSSPYARGLNVWLFNVRLFVFGVVVISRSKLIVTLVGRLVLVLSANDGLTVVVALFVIPILVAVGIVFLGLKVGLHHKLATDATRMGCSPLLGIVVCGTNHVEHAEHCRKRSLVVACSGSATRKALIDRSRTKQQQGQRRNNAQRPKDVARHGRNKWKCLEEGQHQGCNGERPAQSFDEWLPFGKLPAVEEVLARGVKMSNDHDGTVALNDIGAGCTVHANDVLAASLRANRHKRVVALAGHNNEAKGNGGEHQAHHTNNGSEEP